MKNSMLLLLLPVTLALTVAGVFFVLLPERFTGDRTFLVSVLLLSAATGSFIFTLIPGNGNTRGAGVIGSIGIGTLMSGLVVVAASAGIAMAMAGVEKGAMALDIVTLAGFVATLVLVRATGSSSHGNSYRTDKRGNQVAWADRLESIGRGCRISRMKTRLLKLAGETRCLAHDQGMAAAEINQRIANVLETVAEAVRQGDEQAATLQLKRLRNLFAERESELTNMRGRA